MWRQFKQGFLLKWHRSACDFPLLLLADSCCLRTSFFLVSIANINQMSFPSICFFPSAPDTITSLKADIQHASTIIASSFRAQKGTRNNPGICYLRHVRNAVVGFSGAPRAAWTTRRSGHSTKQLALATQDMANIFQPFSINSPISAFDECRNSSRHKIMDRPQPRLPI